MKNQVIFMCGSHARHLHVAETLWKEGRLAALVIEVRENIIPTPPESLSERDKRNFVMHFKNREEAEKKFFGEKHKEIVKDWNIPVLEVEEEKLNSKQTLDFIKEIDADLLLSYGVHKLSNEMIECYLEKSFNIHGGLSPWYRGCITLFWPFYFLKPNYAGMTIHRLTQQLDGGDILHHSVPKLEYGDRLHDVACKAVLQVADDICKILQELDEGKALKCVRQKSAGKLFLGKDWTPQTLRVVYELFEDRIVDMYLDGELEKEEPKLVNFLEVK